MFPLTLGAGLRLFPEEGSAPVKLGLKKEAEAYESGVVHLSYTAASTS